jgi:hypothetical protein
VVVLVVDSLVVVVSSMVVVVSGVVVVVVAGEVVVVMVVVVVVVVVGAVVGEVPGLPGPVVGGMVGDDPGVVGVVELGGAAGLVEGGAPGPGVPRRDGRPLPGSTRVVVGVSGTVVVLPRLVVDTIIGVVVGLETPPLATSLSDLGSHDRTGSRSGSSTSPTASAST